MKLYHVDAFTSRVFGGNPAAVIPVGEWPDDDAMQAIAAENNLSETAFIGPDADGDDRRIRWFTPEREVDLCGHATLASAHVLWNHEGEVVEQLTFASRSGPLSVSREMQQGEHAMDLIVLDFPAFGTEPVEITAALVEALGARPSELHRSTGAKRNLMAVFESKKDVHDLRPDFETLADRALVGDSLGLIATAPGASHDFVSRYFAPAAGVPEDPVTGSAHCVLAPYWGARLGKSRLSARQVSKRGGELRCDLASSEHGDRVLIAGHAVTYMVGEIGVATPVTA
ncbi:MAG: PhzF family phenazine biosynthesis protein [Planctomycetota bacterium]